MCLCFSHFFSCYWYLVSWCCVQRRCLIWFQFFFNLLRLDLWPKMWSILENVLCTLEKKVYSSAFGWNVLKISMRYISSNISFKTCILLLIFSFYDLSIGVGEVLKSPTIIVLLLISPFMSVSVCFMYWSVPCWVHIYLQLLCLSLELIPYSLCRVLPYLF